MQGIVNQLRLALVMMSLQPLNLALSSSLLLCAADRRAAMNALDINLGWFAGPIYFGDYPAALKVSNKYLD